jgi:hypothetical protein
MTPDGGFADGLAGAGSYGAAWCPIRLRRDGLPPVRFSGYLLGRHSGALPAVTFWHDLALYRDQAGGAAAEIVAWSGAGSAARRVRCHASILPALGDALRMLETHDPSADICPGVSAPPLAFGDPAITPVELSLQAAALRIFRQDVVRRYRIGVGAFLAGLGRQEY